MFTKPLLRAPRYILIKFFFLEIGQSYLHDLSHTFLNYYKEKFLPPTSNIITTLNEIAFSTIFETTQGYFSVWKKVVFFFYLETERFLPIIREKFRKLSEIDGFHYRREFKQFCPLLRRCREPKEMSALDKCFWGYGYAWNSLSHYDDDATISHNNENHNSL